MFSLGAPVKFTPLTRTRFLKRQIADWLVEIFNRYDDNAKIGEVSNVQKLYSTQHTVS